MVEAISLIPEENTDEEEEEVSYAVTILPDDTTGLRYGMNVTGIKECIAALSHSLICAGHGLVRGKDGEVFKTRVHCFLDCDDIRRSCRLKAHRQENDLLLMIILCDLHCIKRSVNDLYLCAFCARSGK